MLQAITTRFHGPTNYRPTRVSARCAAGRVIIEVDVYQDADTPHHAAALALCAKLGWNGALIPGGLPDGSGNCYVFAPGSRRTATTARVVDDGMTCPPELPIGMERMTAAEGREHVRQIAAGAAKVQP